MACLVNQSEKKGQRSTGLFQVLSTTNSASFFFGSLNRRGDLKNVYPTDAAIDTRYDDPDFGYRFIADELIDAGLVTSEQRVSRWTETPESAVRKLRNAKSRLVITHQEYCVEFGDRLISLIQSCPFHTNEGTFV
jgi:hypothetical protein